MYLFLNNREIATVVWLLILLVFCLTLPDVRASLVQIFKISMSKYIIGLVGLMIVYTWGMVVLLESVNLWDFSLLKDTILWFFLSGLVLIVNSVTSVDKKNHIFKKILTENFKLFLFVEFFVNFYTFNIYAELILVPTVTFIGVLGIVAALDKKHEIVVKMVNWIQAFWGILILYYISREFLNRPAEFLSIQTMKQFVSPLCLTMLFFPFLYSSVLYACYENLFVRINFAFKGNQSLRKYTKWMVLKKCHFNFSKIREVSHELSPKVWSMNSKQEIKDFLK